MQRRELPVSSAVAREEAGDAWGEVPLEAGGVYSGPLCGLLWLLWTTPWILGVVIFVFIVYS